MFPTLTLAVVLAAPVPKGKPAGPSYYPLAVGNKWVFEYNDGREYTEEVAAAEPDKDGETRITLRVTSGRADWEDILAVTKEGVAWRATRGKPMNRWLVRYPLTPGSGWTCDDKIQPGLTASGGPVTVGAEEEIEVPTGKFKAIPIRFEERTIDGRPLPEPKRYTDWYAPDVGLVRLDEPTDRRSLKTFTRGKK